MGIGMGMVYSPFGMGMSMGMVYVGTYNYLYRYTGVYIRRYLRSDLIGMGGSGGWVLGYQVSTLEGYVCISSPGPPLHLDLELYSRDALVLLRFR